VILRVEVRVLGLLGRCSATWATSSALFALVIFGIGSQVFFLEYS
jgi:hypothetical protein